jgi:putative oxidoreductase
MEGQSASHGNVHAMKKLLRNTCFILALRIVLGLAFVVASLEKIVDPDAFGISISNYKILPAFIIPVPATILPWMELLCGLSIFFGVLVRGSSLLITTMLLVFLFAVLSAMARGLDITCGCFTQDPDAATIGWIKIAENISLLCASLCLFCSGEGSLSLDHYLRKRTGEDPALPM